MLLEVSTERRGEYTVITVTGEVDRVTCGYLWEQVEDAFGADSPRLLFDLAGMAFVDSSGLRLFMDACKKAHARGGSAALCGLGATPSRIIRLMGLDKYFDTYPTLDTALADPPGNASKARR
jgi:anti-sigma B factor antagonist